MSVTSEKGAGKYLAKYMQKGLHEGLERGMTRRWSTSRDWPCEPRVRLAGSVDGDGWVRRQWTEGPVKDVSELQKHLSANASERRMSVRQAREEHRRVVKAFISLGKEKA